MISTQYFISKHHNINYIFKDLLQTVAVAAVAGIGIIMTIVDHMAEMVVVTATTVSNRILMYNILPYIK